MPLPMSAWCDPGTDAEDRFPMMSTAGLCVSRRGEGKTMEPYWNLPFGNAR